MGLERAYGAGGCLGPRRRAKWHMGCAMAVIWGRLKRALGPGPATGISDRPGGKALPQSGSTAEGKEIGSGVQTFDGRGDQVGAFFAR